MKKIILLLLFMTPLAFGQSADDELVPVKQLIPDIIQDVRYATVNNFTDQKLYTVGEPYLALGAIKKLIIVQDSLKKITSYNGKSYPDGLGIIIFDGYRPRAVQYLMYEIVPNPVFVADPTTGSVHNRGGAVDLSIADLSTGKEIPMPTEFDYFGPEAGLNFNNLPADVLANRELLHSMMTKVGGFADYSAEWWHYTYSPSSQFPLLDFQMK